MTQLYTKTETDAALALKGSAGLARDRIASGLPTTSTVDNLMDARFLLQDGLSYVALPSWPRSNFWDTSIPNSSSTSSATALTLSWDGDADTQHQHVLQRGLTVAGTMACTNLHLQGLPRTDECYNACWCRGRLAGPCICGYNRECDHRRHVAGGRNHEYRQLPWC